MRAILLTLASALLLACAAQQATDTTTAVRDFIAVNELGEKNTIRITDQYSYSALNDTHIILTTRREHFLVQFRRRCRELEDSWATPDIRYDHNKLRARFDTIRGCRIEKIFPIDQAQAEELTHLGQAPGEKT